MSSKSARAAASAKAAEETEQEWERRCSTAGQGRLTAQQSLIMEHQQLAPAEGAALKRLRTLVWEMDLTDEQHEFLTSRALQRFLRARDWDVDKALKMCTDTIAWRDEYQPHRITYSEVEHVMKLGTVYVSEGHVCRSGRPILYMKPRDDNPYPPDIRIKFMAWTVERAITKMRRGAENIVLVLDWSQLSIKGKDKDGLYTARTTIGLLQAHYPERLGVCFMVNSPWWLSAVYTMISPLINPVTRAKVHFVKGTPDELRKQMGEFVDTEHLEEQYGGSVPTPSIEDIPKMAEEALRRDAKEAAAAGILSGDSAELSSLSPAALAVPTSPVAASPA